MEGGIMEARNERRGRSRTRDARSHSPYNAEQSDTKAIGWYDDSAISPAIGSDEDVPDEWNSRTDRVDEERRVEVEAKKEVDTRSGLLKRMRRAIKSSFFGDREKQKSETALRSPYDEKALLQPGLKEKERPTRPAFCSTKGIGGLIASIESACENRVFHRWDKGTSQWIHERRRVKKGGWAEETEGEEAKMTSERI